MTRSAESQRTLVAASFDAIARDYARGQARRLDVERVADLVEVGPRDHVLDVATGTGAVAWHLAPRAGVTVGIDASPGMLAAAQRPYDPGRPRPLLVTGAAEALPFLPASFDAVVTSRALHHMHDPAAAIGEMARVARDGARFALVDPVSYDDPAWAAEHNALERERDASHARCLARGELVGVVERAGFAVTSFEVDDTWRPAAEWLADAGAGAERTAAMLAALRERAEAGDAFARAHVRADAGGEIAVRYQLAWLAARRETE